MWCSIRLFDKQHICENILGQFKATERRQDSGILIFSVKSAQFQELWDSAKVLFVPLKS